MIKKIITDNRKRLGHKIHTLINFKTILMNKKQINMKNYCIDLNFICPFTMVNQKKVKYQKEMAMKPILALVEM
jgi:hypothetical protein